MEPDRVEGMRPLADRPETVSLDVASRLVPQQLEIRADESTLSQLRSIGRTEDVVVSPSGTRLALAAFVADFVALVDVAVERGGDASAVRLTKVTIVRADGLARPHGMAFVDDETLLVANRESELVVLDIGDVDPSVTIATVPSRVLIDGAAAVPVRTPGSVAVRWIDDDLLEVFVCNNYVNDVTRHLVDRAAGWEVVDAEPLLARGLQIPDGIALSHCGSWLAVSNHNTNSVHVYRYDASLGPTSEPDAVLQGMNYPHGLAFTPDDRYLVVADAGLPYVLAYRSDRGDWAGSLSPARITRVMDDASFHRGRHNPQEGGPKGLALLSERIAVVTSEYQPLGFFVLDDLLGRDHDEITSGVSELRRPRRSIDAVAFRRTLSRLSRSERDRHVAVSNLDALGASFEQVVAARDEVAGQRDDLLRQRDEGTELAHTLAAERNEAVRARDEAVRERDEAVRERDEACESAYLAELAVRRSRSWRLTAPFRSVTEVGRRLRRPLRG